MHYLFIRYMEHTRKKKQTDSDKLVLVFTGGVYLDGGGSIGSYTGKGH